MHEWIYLKRSSQLLVLQMLLHGLTMGLILMASIRLWAQVVAMIFIVISFARYWYVHFARQSRKSINAIALDDEGYVWLSGPRLNNCRARVLSSSFISEWFILLQLRLSANERFLSCVIMNDSISSEDKRRQLARKVVLDHTV